MRDNDGEVRRNLEVKTNLELLRLWIRLAITSLNYRLPEHRRIEALKVADEVGSVGKNRIWRDLGRLRGK